MCPRLPSVQVVRGVLCECAGDVGNAEAAYRLALASDQYCTEAHARLYMLYKSLGDNELADSHMEMACYTDPNHPLVLYVIIYVVVILDMRSQVLCLIRS